MITKDGKVIIVLSYFQEMLALHFRGFATTKAARRKKRPDFPHECQESRQSITGVLTLSRTLVTLSYLDGLKYASISSQVYYSKR